MVMPNIYVPEEVFKMYVEKYGYTEAKIRMQEVLRDSIIAENSSISKASVR